MFNNLLLESLISAFFPNAQYDKEINGKLAVDAVLAQDKAGQPYELIFMDVNMPEMDGFEAAELIFKYHRQGVLKFKPFITTITATISEET